MVSEMLVELVSAEVHRSGWGNEVGTATFKKLDDPERPFTVSTTGGQAISLLKASVDTKNFAIAIEPALVAFDPWAYRLVSAVAVARSAPTP
jgi:hypothetical protein